MGGGEREVRVHLLLENVRKFLVLNGTLQIVMHSNCGKVVLNILPFILIVMQLVGRVEM